MERFSPCDAAKACVIIPVYDHARTVADVVRRAREHASTVLVCDDGSRDGSGDAAEAAGAVVLRHVRNRGKGAALRTLFAEAERRGFRLALSLDADGQHLPEDIPSVLRAALEAPEAITVGARDLVAAGAPSRNDFGRRASNFWVWFETGEDVPDSQSGFRAYPLPLTRKLGAWRSRYDFEVEVLLKAAWAGLGLRHTPIRVIYPEDRVTHLRPIWDITRITVVNILACLRMLLPFPLARPLRPLPHLPGRSLFAVRTWFELGGRGPLFRTVAAVLGVLPLLVHAPRLTAPLVVGAAIAGVGALPTALVAWGLGRLVSRGTPLVSAALELVALGLLFGLVERWTGPRGAQRVPGAQWTGRSRGGAFGHWFFIQLARLSGHSLPYVAIYPVTLYFVFAAPAARRASMQFLTRVLGPADVWTRWWRSYQHLLSFARMMVDRAFLYTRGTEGFRYTERGCEHIVRAAEAGKGGILLTAHVGNWAVPGRLLPGEVAGQVTIVAHQGEDERIARYLDRAQGPRPRTIASSNEPLASLELFRQVREGRLLAFQGDRAGEDNFVRLPFLGREANFPLGPFLLAAASGAPVIATFSAQVGPARYELYALPPMFVDRPRGPERDAQIRVHVERYVTALEEHARAHPYQWFNFYDFWAADAAPRANEGSAASAPRPTSITR